MSEVKHTPWVSFDPSKVERLTNSAISALYIADKLELGDEFVAASDYDALLALYREVCARHWPEPLQQLASPNQQPKQA